MGELNTSVADAVFYCKSDDTNEWKALGNVKSIETTYPEDPEPTFYTKNNDQHIPIELRINAVAITAPVIAVNLNQLYSFILSVDPKFEHLSKHGKNKRIRKKNLKKYMKILIKEIK